MRIVLLMNSLYTGGAEFSSLQFYSWLKKESHDISIVCYKRAEPSYFIKDFGFEEVYYLPGDSFWARWQAFRSYVKKIRPNLVHSVLFEANIIGRLSRMFGGNFIHLESLVNEMYSENRYSDPQVTRLKLQGYRLLDYLTQLFGVDHYHANGESVAKHYRLKLFINKNRITVIQRGRSANAFINDSANKKKLLKELNGQGRLVLINVARNEYQKGLDVLLDSVSRLGVLSQKIKVVLVGREGKLSKIIRDKISMYKLEECVLLFGHRNDVPGLLAAADIFVFPSRFEGLSGALIEAEAAQLPIVCSDIPNNHEVVVENKNALLFPVDDVEHLATQLRMLIEDEALRQEMGKNSLSIFEARFSLEKSHLRMKQLIESLINPL